MEVTWVGHATVLVGVDGLRILTDPALTARVAHLRRHHPVDVDVARARTSCSSPTSTWTTSTSRRCGCYRTDAPGQRRPGRRRPGSFAGAGFADVGRDARR